MRAVFFDRDGTLIEDRGHLVDPAQVVFFPGTAPALRRLDGQFLLFIVTNQSGIAKGVTRPEEVRRVNAHVVARLREEGVEIREVYTCPHQRSDGCACIKPNPWGTMRSSVHTSTAAVGRRSPAGGRARPSRRARALPAMSSWRGNGPSIVLLT